MHVAPAVHAMDVVGPLLAALAFVAGMSRVREPFRREVNALLVAGAAGAYLNGGFGAWELAYPAIGLALAYGGLRSYRFIGVAWLAHAGWDALHHLYGDPIWPFMATSSFGCLVFDSAIAVWFLSLRAQRT
jgi:hypothetical protein